MFEINDMEFIGCGHVWADGKLKCDFRYIWRLAVSTVLTFALGMIFSGWQVLFLSYFILTALNFSNGFKPQDYNFEIDSKKSNWHNYIRLKLFYGKKMSLQFLLVWDVGGVLIGGALLKLIGRI